MYFPQKQHARSALGLTICFYKKDFQTNRVQFSINSLKEIVRRYLWYMPQHFFFLLFFFAIKIYFIKYNRCATDKCKSFCHFVRRSWSLSTWVRLDLSDRVRPGSSWSTRAGIARIPRTVLVKITSEPCENEMRVLSGPGAQQYCSIEDGHASPVMKRRSLVLQGHYCQFLRIPFTFATYVQKNFVF